MPPRNEALARLLGAYFHDDWEAEHASAEACLDRMLRESPAPQRRRCASDIASLLGGSLCESQIRDVLVHEAGCAYAFERDGFEASSWLAHVRRRLLDSTGGTE